MTEHQTCPHCGSIQTGAPIPAEQPRHNRTVGAATPGAHDWVPFSMCQDCGGPYWPDDHRRVAKRYVRADPTPRDQT